MVSAAAPFMNGRKSHNMRVFPHRLQYPLPPPPPLPSCFSAVYSITASLCGQPIGDHSAIIFGSVANVRADRVSLHVGVLLALLFLRAKPPLTARSRSRSRRLQLNELRSHLLQQDFRSCGAANIYRAAHKRLQRHDFLRARALLDLFALSHIRLALIAKELYNHC